MALPHHKVFCRKDNLLKTFWANLIWPHAFGLLLCAVTWLQSFGFSRKSPRMHLTLDLGAIFSVLCRDIFTLLVQYTKPNM